MLPTQPFSPLPQNLRAGRALYNEGCSSAKCAVQAGPLPCMLGFNKLVISAPRGLHQHAQSPGTGSASAPLERLVLLELGCAAGSYVCAASLAYSLAYS